MNIDVRAEYDALRIEHGLPPHDPAEERDLRLLDFFTRGALVGVQGALMQIKEAGR